MTVYSIYELRCPGCNMQFAQMIAENEEHLPLPCPSCRTELEKIRKLSGAEMLTCTFNAGGG